MKHAGMTLTALAMIAATGAFAQAAAPLPAGTPDGLYAVVATPRGTIVLELFPDKAPLAVASFVGLAEGAFTGTGKPYFDGIVFHRVEPGFVIQGGDPTGTGSGGPGYRFPNEIDPSLSFDSAGVLGMANAGADTNGSQFFITLAPAKALDGGYTIFGRVHSGMDAVRAIRAGDPMTSVRIVRRGATAEAIQPDRASFDAAVSRYRADAPARAKAAVQAQVDRIAARHPGLKLAKNGSWWLTLKAGDGFKPRTGTRVSVLYTLTSADGTVLDSTASRGDEPFSFVVGARQVVPGFDAAVADMSYGEKRIVVLPPELAYGAAGIPGAIEPNAVLVFEIELLK